MSYGLMWFREDLRVMDNTALTDACNENEQVIALYIIDPAMWQLHDVASCRIELILRNLTALKEALAKKNIPLLTIQIKHTKQIISVLIHLIEVYQITAVYFNEQYELNEKKRDAQIQAALSIPAKSFLDQSIFDPQELLTGNKTPYTIFTPYKRKFLQHPIN